jgi:hypothetical protein
MATYTYIGKAPTSSVNWNDPTIWSGASGFPDASDADVIIPQIMYQSSPLVTFITISNGDSYSANSVSITDNYLELFGSLSVTNNVTLNAGSEIDISNDVNPPANLMIGGSLNLEAGSLDIQGVGQVTVTGTITNASEIIGNGLIVTAGGLDNTGKLIAASGNLTINVTNGFTNLSGSTLTGGSYGAGFYSNTSPNILYLNVGGLITVDAANIDLAADGDIQASDNNGASYVSIETSLQTIASSGTLTLEDQAFNFANPLVDDGTINLAGAVQLNTSQLTVASGATVSGGGVIDASISNSGTIEAELMDATGLGIDNSNETLKIIGAVTGNGKLVIGPGQNGEFVHDPPLTMTLELDGADSNEVVFSNNFAGGGKLILDDVSGFSGAIGNLEIGNTIDLAGIQAVGVRLAGSTLYVTESNSQVLSFQLANPSPNLGFAIKSDGSGGSDIVAVSAASNDINGDGYDDVLIQNNSNGAIIYANMAAGTFSGWVNVGATPGYSVVGTGDINGDGFADIVVQNASGIIDYANMHNGVFSGWVGVGDTPGWNVVGVGDIKGNGYADLVIEDSAGHIDYGDMTGGTFQSWSVVANVPGFNVVGVGDVKGNGYADIVVQNSAGVIDYADMTGGAFSGWVGVGATPGFNVVGVGDINDDGYDDIVIENSSGLIEYGNMNGGTLQSWNVIADMPGWTVAAVEDVNHDGFADVVIENGSGKIEYANMDNGVFNGIVNIANAPGYNVYSAGEAPAGGGNACALALVSVNDPGPSGAGALTPMTMIDPGPSAGSLLAAMTTTTAPSTNAAVPPMSLFDPGPAASTAPTAPSQAAAPLQNILHAGTVG